MCMDSLGGGDLVYLLRVLFSIQLRPKCCFECTGPTLKHVQSYTLCSSSIQAIEKKQTQFIVALLQVAPFHVTVSLTRRRRRKADDDDDIHRRSRI